MGESSAEWGYPEECLGNQNTWETGDNLLVPELVSSGTTGSNLLLCVLAPDQVMFIWWGDKAQLTEEDSFS